MGTVYVCNVAFEGPKVVPLRTPRMTFAEELPAATPVVRPPVANAGDKKVVPLPRPKWAFGRPGEGR